MKYSVFSVCTPEYDICDTVQLLKNLGFDGVEWRVADPPPAAKPADYTFEGRYWSYNRSTLDISQIEKEAARIKDICSQAGIEICALATYLGLWDVVDIERALNAAQAMECPSIRVDMPFYDGTENYRSLFSRSAAQVIELAKLAARYQVRINFETHMGNIIPSASAAYRLVSGCDPNHIGIIFDPGNMVYEGFENYRLGIELLGEYLAHVHVKNSLWQLNGTSDDGVNTWNPTWAPFKKGYADLGNLIQVLRESNYSGYLSVEDFSNQEETAAKLKGDLEFLRRL
ncbi:MAG TPA: sugar phosphate isomerase/epimerase [Clostridiales bacterium]|nr:sugar phosphate isomerase/epimerase [Clostridiales bacterium]